MFKVFNSELKRKAALKKILHLYFVWIVAVRYNEDFELLNFIKALEQLIFFT